MKGAFQFPQSPTDPRWPKDKKTAKRMIEKHNRGQRIERLECQIIGLGKRICFFCNKPATAFEKTGHQVCTECYKKGKRTKHWNFKKSSGENLAKKQKSN